METLTVPFELKSLEAEAGTLWGYGSVFNVVDRQGDRVIKGAFRETLKARNGTPLPMLWSHQPAEPIGVWTSAVEDDYGLKVHGRLILSVQKARETRDLMLNGAVGHLSIGYFTPPGGARLHGDVRELHQLELVEISPCVIPACEPAAIGGIKAGDGGILERFLRDDCDLDRAEAKWIVRYYLDRIGNNPPPPMPQGESMRAQLRRAVKDAAALEAKQREFIWKTFSDEFRRKAERQIDRKNYSGRLVSVEEQLEEWRKLKQDYIGLYYFMSPQKAQEEVEKHFPQHSAPRQPYTEFDHKGYQATLDKHVESQIDEFMAGIKRCKDEDDLVDLLDSRECKEWVIEELKYLTYGTK